MSKYHIEQAQQVLKEAGHYTGEIDGDFGKLSLEAVHSALGAKPKQAVSQSPQDDPAWIVEAQKHIGLKEIVGVRHNRTILSWIKNLGGWFKDDETPWCGTFVSHCLKEGGRSVPKHWYRALAYADYGTKLSQPAYGCIGVMGRKGGGHVCFIVGETNDRRYLVGLGGNQSNAVTLAKFPKSRFIAWIWPSQADGVSSTPYPSRYDLPKYGKALKESRNEA